MIRKLLVRIAAFFWPGVNTPLSMRLAPYLSLGFITTAIILAASAGWTYTNTTQFCGTSCHTMPPEYMTHMRSPHSRVDCVECHLGREVISVQLPRKIAHSSTLYAMVFKTYEYPIIAKKMRPANEACETCHFPRKFSTDSLREIRTYFDDEANTPKSIYLMLKTGGGSIREGLGRGIHWHIENNVTFYAEDALQQNIPYVRVRSDDGTMTEFIDMDASGNAGQVANQSLDKVDCITCHNRVTHTIPTPAEAVDLALNGGLIPDELPFVRGKAIELLSQPYETPEEAKKAFSVLKTFYQDNYPAVYAAYEKALDQLLLQMANLYNQTQFPEQELDWTSHPDNLGHKDSPGCFRCHDNRHISKDGQVIRMECNLCHSIPVVADPSNFVTNISIVRGAEPASHITNNWVGLHGKAIDFTCVQCHPGKEPSVDWTTLNDQKPPADGSFCGNSACHQSVWKFVNFK